MKKMKQEIKDLNDKLSKQDEKLSKQDQKLDMILQILQKDGKNGTYTNQFHNPFLAFLITTLWSVGEINHEEDMKFRFDFTFYNFLANLFVLIFFFLIVLVFMNFLNGLAVSDVRELKEDAEIRNQILRIDIIYHTGTVQVF